MICFWLKCFSLNALTCLIIKSREIKVLGGAVALTHFAHSLFGQKIEKKLRGYYKKLAMIEGE